MLLLLTVSHVSAWNITNRWTSTKTDGGGNQRGDALTLLWSVVPDGEGYSRASNSDLIDYLDVGWNVAEANRTPDLTNRPWWNLMRRVYDQYSRVSGLTMVYEPEQEPDGTDTGKSGDIRIGGVPFTWENDKGGVLADNSFPNNGDMRIDTYRGGNGQPSWWHTNSNAFRNLISHESGHGVGLSHDSSNGRNFVMETPLQTSFWGLQFDDIYAFHRLYGDPLEKNGGNDTFSSATPLGNLTQIGDVRLGEDANNFSVSEMDDQWLGIDGNSDEDWFQFSTVSTSLVDISVTPLGPSYSTNAQGSVNTKAMSDLSFTIYESDGSTVLTSVDTGEAGIGEEVLGFVTPGGGDWYIEVDGETDLNQFYQLDVSVFDIGLASDLDGSGSLTTADWLKFKQGQGMDFAGMTASQAAEYGDLDGDFDNDLTDFIYFKTAFVQEFGPRRVEAMFSVPEPSALLLASLAGLVGLGRRYSAGKPTGCGGHYEPSPRCASEFANPGFFGSI